jgi:hypothetical protein
MKTSSRQAEEAHRDILANIQDYEYGREEAREYLREEIAVCKKKAQVLSAAYAASEELARACRAYSKALEKNENVLDQFNSADSIDFVETNADDDVILQESSEVQELCPNPSVVRWYAQVYQHLGSLLTESLRRI